MSRSVPRALVPGRPRPLDVAVALVAFAGALLLQAHDPIATPPPWLTGLTPHAVGLLAVQTLPYAWRVAAPVTVLAVTLTPQVLVAVAVRDWPTSQVVPALLQLAVLYSVAAHRRPRVSVSAAVACAVLLLAAHRTLLPSAIALEAGWQGVAWAAGFLVRRRRRAREAQLRRRVAAVRDEIAHELHDVVAHQVSEVVVQAGAARSVAATRPEVARQALAGIAATGREALAAMRRMLAVLRQGGSDGAAPGSDPRTSPRGGALRGAVDVLVVLTPVALFAVGRVATALAGSEERILAALTARPALAVPVLAVLLGALFWRRHRPVWTVLVVTAAAAAYDGLGGDQVFGNVAVLLAVYAAGAYLVWWRAVLALLGSYAVFAAVELAGVRTAPDREGIYMVAPLVLAVGLAVAWRRRRREERRRDQQDRAVEVERVRISRELHDVVAHHLTGIVVQASAAELRPADDRAGLEAAVAGIQDAGREALLGLRRLLDVLHGPAADTGLTPQPALADLEVLVDGMRRAGLRIELHVEDAPEVDAETGLFAYRIVQEALTNCLKHAGDAPVSVHVRADGADLVLEVRNDRATRAPRSVFAGGQGLIGMRERAELLDGRLTAGPSPDGGWTVTARLRATGKDRERGWVSTS